MSAAMYVAETDTRDRKIFVPKGHKEKGLQAAMLQYYERRNRKVVADFLQDRGRGDLLRRIDHIRVQKSDNR